VLCHFLEVFLDTDIDRTVPSAESAIRRATSVRVLDQTAIDSDRDLQELPPPDTNPGSVANDWEAISESPLARADSRTASRTSESNPSSREASLSDSLTQGYRITEFTALVRRLTDLAGHVNDHLVQAALIELEATLATSSSVEDFLAAVLKVLDSLSR
jgi:hypothetical protein